MMTCPKCQEEIGSMSRHYCPLIAESPAKEKPLSPSDATAGSVIPSTPEHGVGEQEMTFRMAANAIWNKLNFAMGMVREDGQLMDLLSEARALADSIVHHPNSGSQNADAMAPADTQTSPKS